MAMHRPDVPAFAAIPPGLVPVLRPHAGTAVEHVLLQAPDDTVEEREGEVAREAIAGALEHFYDLVEDSRPVAWGRVTAEYVELGRRLVHDEQVMRWRCRLMYRSARALWHTVDTLAEVDALAKVEIAPRTLGVIAEAQFGFIDAASAAIAHGYRSQVPDDHDLRRRTRGKLVTLLLAGRPDPEVIADAARLADWAMPRTVAAAVLHPRPGHDPRSLIVPGDVLVGPGAKPCLLIPDPDGPGRSRLLQPLLRDWIVSVGPAMPTAQAAESMRWARDALTLAERGVISDRDVIVSAEHVPTLVIFQAEGLISTAAATRLAPLREVPPSHRDRLAETLLALLECHFNATEAALRLHVHPQTVRYRLRRLEALFGETLRDPRACLELEMILHARFGGLPRQDRAVAAAVL